MEHNMSAHSDDELVVLFAQGQSEAFEELLLRHKNGLYQYILSLVKDEGAAGDLFQEVFLALYTHAADFKAQGKVKSWLFLTARNKSLNYLRDHKSLSSLDEQDEEGNEFWHEILPDGEASQLEQLTQQEHVEQIREIVSSLPPHQQEVLYLRPYFSFKEIAEMVGKPIGTVLADCHRGLEKIRKILMDQPEVEL
jgi:RNA polymerase sigma-70 factor (ECF subfamily)